MCVYKHVYRLVYGDVLRHVYEDVRTWRMVWVYKGECEAVVNGARLITCLSTRSYIFLRAQEEESEAYTHIRTHTGGGASRQARV